MEPRRCPPDDPFERRRRSPAKQRGLTSFLRSNAYNPTSCQRPLKSYDGSRRFFVLAGLFLENVFFPQLVIVVLHGTSHIGGWLSRHSLLYFTLTKYLRVIGQILRWQSIHIPHSDVENPFSLKSSRLCSP
eukprot:scaffold6026_cov163-Amphora_coffeaeformis.AAC.15